MSLVEKLRDDFDAASVELYQEPKNGTITQAAGVLSVGIASGVDGSWYGSDNKGPRAGFEEGIVRAYLDENFSDGGNYPGSGFIPGVVEDQYPSAGAHTDYLVRMGETRLVAAPAQASGIESFGGLALWTGDGSMFGIGYYPNTASVPIHFQGGVIGSFAGLWSGGTHASINPNTTAVRFRLYWNQSGWDLGYLGPDGSVQLLDGNELHGWYSGDDGATWSKAGANYTFAFDVHECRLGVYARNWGALPATQYDYDWLTFNATTNDQLLFFQGQRGGPQAGIEDAIKLGKGGAPDRGGEIPGATQHDDIRVALFRPSTPQGLDEGNAGQDASSYAGTTGYESGYEDTLELLDAGGQPQHHSSLGLSAGAPLPDAAGTEPRHRDRTDQAAIEDFLEIVAAAPEGTSPYVQLSSLGITAGLFVPGPPGQYAHQQQPNQPVGFEDACQVVLDPALDYSDGIVDGDGRALHEGYESQAITRYNAAADRWGQTRVPGDGFYGAAKNGTIYIDGEPTGFASFGTLAAGINRLAWNESNGDKLSLSQNGSSKVDISMAADGKVQFQTNATITGWEGVALGSAYRWYLEGDFDIEVSWEDFASSGGSDGGLGFELLWDYNHYLYIRRNVTGKVDTNIKMNGSWNTYYSVNTSVTSGKFRVTRAGTLVRRYYDIGAGWVQIGVDRNPSDKRCWIKLIAAGDGNITNLHVKVNTPIVTTGTLSNKIGWAAEPAGDHRGSQVEFPDNAVIMSNAQELSIIDEDTNKLWMRFQRAANNVLDDWSGSYIRSIKMHEGVMLLANGTWPTSATDEGGGVVIDFNLDWIRIHRESPSTLTGATYKSRWGAANWGRDRAIGCILDRNGAEDWANDADDWATPAYSHQDVDIFHDTQYQYRVCATRNGVSIFRWERWELEGASPAHPDNPENASSNETAQMYWCYLDPVSLRLHYMDASKFYSVDQATWELRFTGAFGGTWDADDSRDLPGSRIHGFQYHCVKLGSKFYLPSDEGIWEIDWPLGTWTLLYGRTTDSSAVHSILPRDMNRVRRIVQADDGAHNLLLVQAEYEDRDQHQIIALKLNDNTVFAKTPLVRGQTGRLWSMSA